MTTRLRMAGIRKSYGLTAALRTADWVSADYQLVAIKGVSHWVPEEAPRALADAALARIGV